MEAVKNWPRPLTAMDIRSFLGLMGYYRRFVDGFASISSALSTWTQKCKKFEWSEACERSFQMLKDRLTSSSGLTLPKVVLLYIVTHPESVWVCAYEKWEYSLCL